MLSLLLYRILKNTIAVDAEKEANGGYYEQFLGSPRLNLDG
jgi:hypothetical protein